MPQSGELRAGHTRDAPGTFPLDIRPQGLMIGRSALLSFFLLLNTFSSPAAESPRRAFFVSVIASTSSFLFLGVLGFVLVSRSYASIVALLMKDSSLVLYGDEYRSGVGALGYLFPDLGGLDVRMISIYGRFDFFPDDWVYLMMSALIYGFVFLMLAVWAFQRKVLS